MNCQSCGMPMSQDSDHGGGRPDNIYCAHCTDSSGNLKSREEIREGMIGFYQQSIGKTREEAEIAVDAHMAQMPTWSGVSAAVGTTVPIDQLPEGTDPVGTVNPALPMESVKPVEPAEPVEPAPPVPVEPATNK